MAGRASTRVLASSRPNAAADAVAGALGGGLEDELEEVAMESAATGTGRLFRSGESRWARRTTEPDPFRLSSSARPTCSEHSFGGHSLAAVFALADAAVACEVLWCVRYIAVGTLGADLSPGRLRVPLLLRESDMGLSTARVSASFFEADGTDAWRWNSETRRRTRLPCRDV